mmetsp:Transcript_62283/g.147573  ORF Transcript_62283/g.147573 Transcript_62283/m.147573 type:complete len:246 (+) Transcript_62283:343-1080(+)
MIFQPVAWCIGDKNDETGLCFPLALKTTLNATSDVLGSVTATTRFLFLDELANRRNILRELVNLDSSQGVVASPRRSIEVPVGDKAHSHNGRTPLIPKFLNELFLHLENLVLRSSHQLSHTTGAVHHEHNVDGKLLSQADLEVNFAQLVDPPNHPPVVLLGVCHLPGILDVLTNLLKDGLFCFHVLELVSCVSSRVVQCPQGFRQSTCVDSRDPMLVTGVNTCVFIAHPHANHFHPNLFCSYQRL